MFNLKRYEVPYKFCNDYAGSRGGLLRATVGSSGSDGRELMVPQSFFTPQKTLLACPSTLTQFLSYTRLEPRQYKTNLKAVHLRGLPNLRRRKCIPIVSPRPPASPYYFLLAPLPLKAAILSSHLPQNFRPIFFY